MTRFTPLLFSVLLLSACQTLDGLGQDLDSAWQSSTDRHGCAEPPPVPGFPPPVPAEPPPVPAEPPPLDDGTH